MMSQMLPFEERRQTGSKMNCNQRVVSRELDFSRVMKCGGICRRAGPAPQARHQEGIMQAGAAESP